MKYWRRVLFYSLPLIAAGGMIVLINTGSISDWLFVGRFEISSGGLILLLGICASTLLIVRGLVMYWNHRRISNMRVEEQDSHTAAQRRFLQRLDHELKNPLTIIQLGLANLRMCIPVDEHQSFARIEEQTHRLQRVVEDLRRLAELDQITPEHGDVDLGAVLEEVINTVRDSASSRRLILNVRQIPWKPPPICADRDLLEIAFRNLLDNAIKYSSPDGTVEVRVLESRNAAVVEIADTGFGIEEADLPHIYEELYRGMNTRHVSGSGLGLAMVKRIMDLHQGQIDISSRINEGTVVTLHFPRTSGVRN